MNIHCEFLWKIGNLQKASKLPVNSIHIGTGNKLIVSFSECLEKKKADKSFIQINHLGLKFFPYKKPFYLKFVNSILLMLIDAIEMNCNFLSLIQLSPVAEVSLRCSKYESDHLSDQSI